MKKDSMASYIITVNGSSEKAKRFIEFIKDYASDNSFVQIKEIPGENTGENVKKPVTYKVENKKNILDSE